MPLSPPPAAAPPSAQRPRVLFCLRGDATRASSRVRGHWIAEELSALGVTCRLHVARSSTDFLRCATLIPRHDVIVFQKRYAPNDLRLMRLARSLGCRTFLDLDDAPRAGGAPRAAAMMRMADGVLAGSRSLVTLARAENPQTFLVPTGIRLDNYPVAASGTASSRICLGWIGNGADYAVDLVQVLREPITLLAARFPVRLKIVGACANPHLHEAFRNVPGLDVEMIDQVDWASPQAVSAATADFDIGLYPLLDTAFNGCKCGFKALEYMARGKPTVASNIISNAEIVSDGVDGLLASGTGQWVDRLATLIENPDLRARFGAAGRRKVETAYSTRAIARTLLDIFAPAPPLPAFESCGLESTAPIVAAVSKAPL